MEEEEEEEETPWSWMDPDDTYVGKSDIFSTIKPNRMNNGSWLLIRKDSEESQKKQKQSRSFFLLIDGWTMNPGFDSIYIYIYISLFMYVGERMEPGTSKVQQKERKKGRKGSVRLARGHRKSVTGARKANLLMKFSKRKTVSSSFGKDPLSPLKSNRKNQKPKPFYSYAEDPTQ